MRCGLKSFESSHSLPWACVLSGFSLVWLFMKFSREESWSGLPRPPPGDLPDPEIEPTSPMAPALQVDSLPLSHRGSPFPTILWVKAEHPEVNYDNLPELTYPLKIAYYLDKVCYITWFSTFLWFLFSTILFSILSNDEDKKLSYPDIAKYHSLVLCNCTDYRTHRVHS